MGKKTQQPRKLSPEDIQKIRDAHKKKNKRLFNVTRKRRANASKTMLILELNKLDQAFEVAEAELINTQNTAKDFASFIGFMGHPQYNYDIVNYITMGADIARTDVPAYVMCQNCMHLNIIREGDKNYWAYFNFDCSSCSHLLSGIMLETFPTA